jgi:hypothetical protein
MVCPPFPREADHATLASIQQYRLYSGALESPAGLDFGRAQAGKVHRAFSRSTGA